MIWSPRRTGIVVNKNGFGACPFSGSQEEAIVAAHQNGCF